MNYDYLIVGAGPTGLTLAWILGQAGKKVLLLDREKTIGGCHRVRRVNGLFTEHGPRIYISNANTFKNVLRSMGLDFAQMFTRYNFNITSVGGDSFKILKLHEIFAFVIAFLGLMVNPNYSRQTTVGDFMRANNFTVESFTFIDNACRLTDGGDANRYTLFELLQAVNQHVFTGIVQPVLPNDLGLFRAWESKLRGLGNVEILLNHQVVGINLNQDGKLVDSLQVSPPDQSKPNQKVFRIKAKNYIFALPTNTLIKLLSQPQLDSNGASLGPSTRLLNAFGNYQDLVQWYRNTKYMLYIPVVFHWDQKLKLPKVWGFPRTDWGIAWIVLSDYMKFDDPRSQTVISTCIARADGVSRQIGKTPHQCSEGELIDEVFDQVKLAFPNLPEPTESILSPGVFRNQAGLWDTRDASFLLGTLGYQPKMQSPLIPNLFWAGSHNGNQKYHFTSIETAVSNGVALAHQLLPESRQAYPIKGAINLIQIIWGVILLIGLAIWYFLIYRKTSN